ncbi:hypothetical protein ACGF4C_14000 [Streptomyces sp. NPDC048197]|uniref:hypothetical protein n=1 Tax=Streptomyces sp. NPDC048197 TaxID=3365511 RepID=UPI003718075D
MVMSVRRRWTAGLVAAVAVTATAAGAAAVLDRVGASASDEKPNLDAIAAYPHAWLMEDRDTTRTRLVAARLTGNCLNAPRSGTWAAFELRRDVTVTEKFTLGEGRSPVKQALMWDRAAAACFHTHPSVMTVLIGIETKGDYTTAKKLGAYAVVTNSPKHMMEVTNKPAATTS